MIRFLAATVFPGSALAGFPGLAAQETGQAVAVAQSASATAVNGKRTLEAGMTVSVGECIETGRTGRHPPRIGQFILEQTSLRTVIFVEGKCFY